MGGLWLVLLIMQVSAETDIHHSIRLSDQITKLYMLIVGSSYAKAQQVDRTRYNSFYESANPLNSDIPMKSRANTFRGHVKKDSDVSNRSTDQLNPPENAYTYEPTPTPSYNHYGDDNHGMTQVPPRTQPHIGESKALT